MKLPNLELSQTDRAYSSIQELLELFESEDEDGNDLDFRLKKVDDNFKYILGEAKAVKNFPVMAHDKSLSKALCFYVFATTVLIEECKRLKHNDEDPSVLDDMRKRLELPEFKTVKEKVIPDEKSAIVKNLLATEYKKDPYEDMWKKVRASADTSSKDALQLWGAVMGCLIRRSRF